MTRARKSVVLVAAVASNGVIGLDGDIPWKISEDLKHFRAATTGHTVVMGRRTFESIGHPLPNRTNVVVTRDPDWTHQAVFVAHTVDEAIEQAQEFGGEVMVIGGGGIYAAALPLADAQLLTEVHQSPAGDTHYPEWDRAEWREVSRDAREGYDFVRWERRQGQRPSGASTSGRREPIA